MRRFLKFFARLSALLLGLSLCISPLGGFAAYDFEYEQAVGNPLKGFMPFYKQGGAADSVPYSMEWFYVPLSALMSDSGEYTIREGLEPYLEEISARGNQAVFRVYLDYPGSGIGEKAVPQFIWDMGIKKSTTTNTAEAGAPTIRTAGSLISSAILCASWRVNTTATAA